MDLEVSEANLLTFKSQLPLQSDDIIAVRDTVDNSVSIGINTIGDFDSYYISTSTPSFGHTFVGSTTGITGNITNLSDLLGETQINGFTITHATATVERIPFVPLTIKNASAVLNEVVTPNLILDGFTLTYQTASPVSYGDSRIILNMTKVVENQVVRVEVKPKLAVEFTNGCNTFWPPFHEDCNITTRRTTVVLDNLEYVDVTALVDVRGLNSNIPKLYENIDNLPIVFQGDGSGDHPLGVCMISQEFRSDIDVNNYFFSNILYPLYFQGFGKLDSVSVNSNDLTVDLAYKGTPITTLLKAKDNQWNENTRCDGGCFDAKYRGNDYVFRAGSSGFKVKVTFQDGSTYETPNRAFGPSKIFQRPKDLLLNTTKRAKFVSKFVTGFLAIVKDLFLINYKDYNRFKEHITYFRKDITKPAIRVRTLNSTITHSGGVNGSDSVSTFTTSPVRVLDFTTNYVVKSFLLTEENVKLLSISLFADTYEPTRELYCYQKMNTLTYPLTTYINSIGGATGLELQNITRNGDGNIVANNVNNNLETVILMSNTHIQDLFKNSTGTILPNDGGVNESNLGEILLDIDRNNLLEVKYNIKGDLKTSTATFSRTSPGTINLDFTGDYIDNRTITSINRPALLQQLRNLMYNNQTQNIQLKFKNSGSLGKNILTLYGLKNSTEESFADNLDRINVDSNIQSATISYKFLYEYNIPPGIQLLDGTTSISDVTTGTGTFNLVNNEYATFRLDKPSVDEKAVTVVETIPLTQRLRSLVRPNQTLKFDSINYDSVTKTIHSGSTGRFPITAGYLLIDYSYRGFGENTINTDIFSISGGITKLTQINISNINSSSFTPTTLEPITFDITKHISSIAGPTGLFIDKSTIAYNADGGINALGISASQLQFCEPDLETLVYNIKYKVGSKFYYYTDSVTGTIDSNLTIGPTLTSNTQTIFSMIDREKTFTSSQIPSGTLTLYFTTISANRSGYTFTETPFIVYNASRNDPLEYKIYKASAQGININTNVSKILDINDFSVNRSKIGGFNTATYTVSKGIPIALDSQKALFNQMLDFVTVNDTKDTTMKTITKITIKPDFLTFTKIVNNFIVIDNVYEANNPTKTYSMYLFVTPILSIPIPPIIPIIPNYPFWMPSYTQNSDGSITGIPTLDTSFLQNTYEKRAFSGITLTSNYISDDGTNLAFSLDEFTDNNYLVGNSYIALANLAGTTISSSTPFNNIGGVSTELIQGFNKQDHRFSKKLYSITTNTDKELYVLPFVYKGTTSYDVQYSSNMIVYKYAPVNNSDSVYCNWPVGINTSNIVPPNIYYNNSYQIPGPLALEPNQVSYCPTVIAHPGYITINVPFNGLYLKLNTNRFDEVNYVTKNKSLQITTNKVRTYNMSQYNPIFTVEYKDFEIEQRFSVDTINSCYTTTITNNSRIRLSDNQLASSFLYADQVYEDLHVNAYFLQPTITTQDISIETISSASYLQGHFVLPRFYIPTGIELSGSTGFISVTNNANFFSLSQTLTFNLASSSGGLLFEGTTIGYSNPGSTLTRFSLTVSPEIPTLGEGSVGPIVFDLTQASNSVTIPGLRGNKVYDNYILTYYPYITNSNADLRSYFEVINLGVSSLTPNSGVLNIVSTSVQETISNYREYTINLDELTLSTATGDISSFVSYFNSNQIVLVIDLTDNTVSNLKEKPCITNITPGITNRKYSTSGILELEVNANTVNMVYSTKVSMFSSFLIENLYEGHTYNPKIYLRTYKVGQLGISNVINTESINVKTSPNIMFERRGQISSSLTASYIIKDFNVYDRLFNINFSLPRYYGGNLLLLDSEPFIGSKIIKEDLNNGSIELSPNVSYPSNITVPLNKNVIPNTLKSIYFGYNPRKHEPTGWNQYTMTVDQTGQRNFVDNERTTSISYLKESIISPLTTLSISETNDLCNMLGKNAVIYGSSLLYAYLKTNIIHGGSYSSIPGNTAIHYDVNDIDIAVNDLTLLRDMVDFISNKLSPNKPDIYDPYNLYSGNSGSTYFNYFTTQYAQLDPGGQIVLNNSYPPSQGVTVGNFSITRDTSITGNNQNVDKYFLDAIYRAVTIVPESTGTFPIQLVYVNPNKIPNEFTLAEFLQYNSDFSINAGTYDGTVLSIPNYHDINQGIAVYQEDINSVRKWRTISRLDKYMKRGYTVFFQSQRQVDDWNALQSGIEPYDPWWTDASQSNPKPLNTCPFRVLNKVSIIKDINAVIYPINTGNNGESMITSTILSNQLNPSFGGEIIVRGFNYTKYGRYNVPFNLGGKLSALNATDGTLYGTVNLSPNILYPSQVIIPMNIVYIPPGSHGVSLIYQYDNPLVNGTSQVFTNYITADPILVKTRVTPLIHKIVVDIPTDASFGGRLLNESFSPLVKVYGTSSLGLTFQGNYNDSGITYPSNSLVVVSDKLYRLIGPNTGSPLIGGGWEDTSTKYLDYSGNWNSVLNYTKGQTVVYNNKLYICTGDIEVGQIPGNKNINTGELFNWSTDLELRTVESNYVQNVGYKLVLDNCIPYTDYNVFLQYKTGNIFSPPQTISATRTLNDTIAINNIVENIEGLSYYLSNISYINDRTTLLSDGVLIPFGSYGNTYGYNTNGVTISSNYLQFNSILYTPENSILTNVNDYTNPYIIDTNSYRFTGGVTFTNIKSNSLTVEISNIATQGFTINTLLDNYLITDISRNVSRIIPINNNYNSNTQTLTLNLSSLSEDNTYDLSGTYLVGALQTPVQPSLYLGEITTFNMLAYTVYVAETVDDFNVRFNNFLFDNVNISGIFPYASPKNNVSLRVYASKNKPVTLYVTTSEIIGESVYFNISATSLNGASPRSIDSYILTYNYVDNNGTEKSLSMYGSFL